MVVRGDDGRFLRSAAPGNKNANHLRLRRERGKASNHVCTHCSVEGIVKYADEWAQIHGTDGSNPTTDYISLCYSHHRRYDDSPAAVAESNRRRKGEKRRQYVVKDPEAHREMQVAKSRKRWGGDAR